ESLFSDSEADTSRGKESWVEELGIQSGTRFSFRSFMEGRVPAVIVALFSGVLLRLGSFDSSLLVNFSLTIVGWILVAVSAALTAGFQLRYVLGHDNSLEPFNQISMRILATLLFNAC